MILPGMEFLYGPEPNPWLGEDYKPPKRFEHGKNTLVAKLKGKGDGQDVELYECRLPATFYEIKALDTPDSVGEINKGFILVTGSGECELACKIAKAIASGMLGLKGENRKE